MATGAGSNKLPQRFMRYGVEPPKMPLQLVTGPADLALRTKTAEAKPVAEEKDSAANAGVMLPDRMSLMREVLLLLEEAAGWEESMRKAVLQVIQKRKFVNMAAWAAKLSETELEAAKLAINVIKTQGPSTAGDLGSQKQKKATLPDPPEEDTDEESNRLSTAKAASIYMSPVRKMHPALISALTREITQVAEEQLSAKLYPELKTVDEVKNALSAGILGLLGMPFVSATGKVLSTWDDVKAKMAERLEDEVEDAVSAFRALLSEVVSAAGDIVKTDCGRKRKRLTPSPVVSASKRKRRDPSPSSETSETSSISEPDEEDADGNEYGECYGWGVQKPVYLRSKGWGVRQAWRSWLSERTEDVEKQLAPGCGLIKSLEVPPEIAAVDLYSTLGSEKPKLVIQYYQIGHMIDPRGILEKPTLMATSSLNPMLSKQILSELGISDSFLVSKTVIEGLSSGLCPIIPFFLEISPGEQKNWLGIESVQLSSGEKRLVLNPDRAVINMVLDDDAIESSICSDFVKWMCKFSRLWGSWKSGLSEFTADHFLVKILAVWIRAWMREICLSGNWWSSPRGRRVLVYALFACLAQNTIALCPTISTPMELARLADIESGKPFYIKFPDVVWDGVMCIWCGAAKEHRHKDCPKRRLCTVKYPWHIQRGKSFKQSKPRPKASQELEN